MAQRRLNDASSQASRVFERLASGQRINSASDDAAGLAVASDLNASSRIHALAIRNVNDGISALSISSGALENLKDIVIRQTELAEQAANGTFSRTQRLTMQNEANALVNEYNRILSVTSFNGISLLGSSQNVRIQQGYGTNSYVDIGLGQSISNYRGDGTFSSTAMSSIAVGSQETMAADLNGDGKMDMIAATNGGYVNVRYGNGDGTFNATTTITTNGARYVAVGDVNGDGRADIVHGSVGGNGFAVTLQTSSGWAAPVNYASSLAGIRNGTLSDINGDGSLDLIQNSNTSGVGVEVFLNNGDGTFYRTQAITPTAGASKPVATGDINGDGKMDFIGSGDYGQGNDTYLMIGNGDGTFRIAGTLGVGYATENLVLIDLNNDGLQDIVNPTSTGGIFTRLGNGDGTFRAAQTSAGAAANLPQAGMQAVDLNNDGFADIASLNFGNGRVVTYLSNGDGTFKAEQTSSAGGVSALGLSFGDFNGDGVQDVVTSAGATTYIF